jgi:hypothetical protein
MKNTAVFAIYPSRSAVEEAVEHLRHSGFRATDISVLVPENTGTKDFGHEKATKAPEGAATGTVAGGITGGVLAWLTSVGIIAIPGLANLTAGGPIVAALAGAGAVGAVGAIVGALAGWGVPEYEAVRYEGRVRDGGVLLSVHCDNADWVARAKEALRHTGGQDVGSLSEKHGDFAVGDKPAPRVRTAGSGSVGIEDPLREEDILTHEPPPREILTRDVPTRDVPTRKIDDVA